MTIATIREKLHEYIEIADEDKIKAIYTLLEDRLESPATSYEWSEDEDFVAELNDRYEQYEKGVDKGVSLDELEISIEKRRAQCENDL